ncbi:hypothetical protein DICPUDRAFT_76652 [Dictyostelium purpureum]|uniref:Uncharacterized protein n=1 Tax=Dictyostelium purpureum TaxID=5786 RepID=F0ZE87_DICPU|nr:uncharacterized protein DICPUDRAFT_76652 [Dictyostelium purpureum]EGC37709.1 hypothetical protein DICPUDRAFT_76652 [Dictyostelium purpureum]|eukprot:XP_003285730.1 hypothetical protein DICPUDRAFT_76652 [Dictyostelium purpureum]
MRNSFKVQESNKYLVESWEKANNDSKKHVVNIDESTYKSNLTGGKISFLDTLKPQFEAIKPATSSATSGSTNTSSPSNNFASKNKSSSSSTTSSPSTPSTNTSSPSTNNANNAQSIGAFIPRNINKPWGK